MKNFVYQNRSAIVNFGMCAVGSFVFFKLGQKFAANADDIFGLGSWKTFNFVGNSGRSPIYPFEKRPWIDDIEGRLAYDQRKRMKLHELLTTYRLSQYKGSVHPQRETCDYALVDDALYHQDLEKYLEEQRHEMAIECVQKGVYKDVIEAKEMQRKKRIQYSDYKYKHLLYRE